jgi:DNA ligase (NAD+)
LSIANASKVTLPRFIISLSIPQVGEETAYDLAKYFKTIENLKAAQKETLEVISGVGAVVADSIISWFDDTDHLKMLKALSGVVSIQNMATEEKETSLLGGKTIVLTGTLQRFSRDEAKELIRKAGGETAGSVSSQTDYLVAGESAGSKLKEAEKLHVKVLSEDEFLKLLE